MASQEMTVFQKALLDSVLMEYRDIPEECKLEDHFSKKFHLWANGFIQKQHPMQLRLHRVLRVAIIAAVLIALLLGTAMAIPVVREAVIDYFFHARNESTGITFDPEAAATAPDSIETVYVVSNIPNSFLQTVEIIRSEMVLRHWVSNDLEISFSQIPIGGATDNHQWIGVGNPDDPRKQVLIEEYIVDVIDQGDVYSFLWTNNEYFFIMHIPTDIYWDTMVKIVESVSPVT